MAIENDPTAQGLDAADPQITIETDEQDSFKSGIQKRIDELTARTHEAQRNNEQLMQLLQQKDAQITELVAMRMNQQQAPQEEDVNVDPTIARALERIVGKHLSPVQQQLGQYGQMMQKIEFQNLTANYEPQVVQRADQLMAQWKREGRTGWAMPDALVMASYQLGIPPKPQGQQRAPNGQFAQQTVIDAHAPAPQRTTGPKKRPANFDSLSPEKQLAILEAEGIGDLPL
jgi:hypothetical protein